MCWAGACFAEILRIVPRHKIDQATFNTRDTILLRKVIQGIVSNLISAESVRDSLLGTEVFDGEFVS